MTQLLPEMPTTPSGEMKVEYLLTFVKKLSIGTLYLIQFRNFFFDEYAILTIGQKILVGRE